MLRRGILTVLVIGGLAATGYFAWIAGFDAGSAGEHVHRGHSFFWRAGFVFHGLLLLFLFMLIGKIFFWRRGYGAHAGRWSSRREEWHERLHRERDERDERGGGEEPPIA